LREAATLRFTVRAATPSVLNALFLGFERVGGSSLVPGELVPNCIKYRRRGR
jgi:hypothetical protein